MRKAKATRRRLRRAVARQRRDVAQRAGLRPAAVLRGRAAHPVASVPVRPATASDGSKRRVVGERRAAAPRPGAATCGRCARGRSRRRPSARCRTRSSSVALDARRRAAVVPRSPSATPSALMQHLGHEVVRRRVHLPEQRRLTGDDRQAATGSASSGVRPRARRGAHVDAEVAQLPGEARWRELRRPGLPVRRALARPAAVERSARRAARRRRGRARSPRRGRRGACRRRTRRRARGP